MIGTVDGLFQPQISIGTFFQDRRGEERVYQRSTFKRHGLIEA